MDMSLIEIRRAEVAEYEKNIQMYQSIANTLPSEWPEHLAHLKDSQNHHADIATVESIEDVVLVSNLWAHDSALAAMRAEMVEKAKSQAILAFLEANQ